MLRSHGRQPLDDLLVQLDAQAWAIGHLQVAVLDDQRIPEHGHSSRIEMGSILYSCAYGTLGIPGSRMHYEHWR